MTELSELDLKSNDVQFSLDIGTRNVVGIVGRREKENYVVVDYEIMEHPSRAMYDGQIHDINKVAEVAKEVKHKLEKRLGLQLKHVAIAAAGRALKTFRVQVIREIEYTKEIDHILINSLELEGVQKAQEKLEKEGGMGDSRYYCVGYTVVNYFLNDGLITSLKGHRGTKIGADLLATFLPHVVVDSLHTVMGKIGLEVLNLTLEPIAAIHVAIPPKLRLLNLALIDIGAGTSDIAITQDGTVVAYAMASVAGDEITESIAKEFLLDFDSAERLKIQLNKQDTHTFKDIIGMTYTMSTNDIIERISPAIDMLAKEIADKIVLNNGKAPSAVFCIGGGSQIPALTSYLAEKLNISKERVVIRGTEIIENVLFSSKKLEGPEFITPIGIGIVSLKDHEQDFIEVLVNGNPVKLFNAKKLTISDALIRTGFSARKLISRGGNSLKIKVNGVERVIPGKMGEPAKEVLNHRQASLDAQIKNKDSIAVESAVDGLDASCTIKELIGGIDTISFNGVDIKLISNIKVNNKEVTAEYSLQDRDEVTYKQITYMNDLLEKLNMDKNSYEIYVNEEPVNLDYKIQSRDKIRAFEKDHRWKKYVEPQAIKDENKITVVVNEQAVKIEVDKNPPIFVDIFKYIDFDITKPKGILKLILNGNKANYTDLLKDGDVVTINWD